MGEGAAIFKEMTPTSQRGGRAHPCEPALAQRIRMARHEAPILVRIEATCSNYCNDVRGCKVLDSAKKVSMTLRAAGRSVQRLTRVDR